MQRHTRHIRQWSDKRYKQFYDRAAFIASNTNITMNKAFPGNSLPFPPYLGGVEGWTVALDSGEKNVLFAPFIYKNDHFTKTGSGQT
jgi:hypothetical protein